MTLDELRAAVEPLFTSVAAPSSGDTAPNGKLYATYQLRSSTETGAWASVRALLTGMAASAHKIEIARGEPVHTASPVRLYWREYPSVRFDEEIGSWVAETRLTTG